MNILIKEHLYVGNMYVNCYVFEPQNTNDYVQMIFRNTTPKTTLKNSQHSRNQKRIIVNSSRLANENVWVGDNNGICLGE